MQFRALDKTDSMILKGIAILMIAAHNFLHLVRPAPGENEFNFDPARFQRLLDNIADQPGLLIQQTSAYFGHYGVQIFIFLSAYGLTRKYLSADLHYWRFIRSRVVKLYPAFLMAVALWLLLAGIFNGVEVPLQRLKVFWGDILLKLFPFSNTSDAQALRPVGPWWFLPFIIQFYLIFPLILWATLRLGIAVLPALALLSYALVANLHGEGLILYYNVIGHLPEFCLGIYLAMRPDTRLPGWLLLLVIAIFALGNIYSAVWRLSGLSALVIMLTGWQWAGPWLKENRISRTALIFFGAISMQMFFINGFIRDYFLPMAKENNGALSVLGVCLLSIMATTAAAWILTKLNQIIAPSRNSS